MCMPSVTVSPWGRLAPLCLRLVQNSWCGIRHFAPCFLFPHLSMCHIPHVLSLQCLLLLASPFHTLLPLWFMPSWLLAQTSAGPLSCTLWFDWDSPSVAVILSCASVQALSVPHPVGCVIHKPDTGTCDVLGPPPISLTCVLLFLLWLQVDRTACSSSSQNMTFA